MNNLTDAIATTSAYVAFDATGGGTLASNLLSCMEAAAQKAPVVTAVMVLNNTSRFTSTEDWTAQQRPLAEISVCHGVWAAGF